MDSGLQSACDLFNAEAREAWADLLRRTPFQTRYGWKRSKLDEQQREYIIQRQSILDAVKAVQNTTWQSIDITDRQLAEAIRENCLHALATMARAMNHNEERIIE